MGQKAERKAKQGSERGVRHGVCRVASSVAAVCLVFARLTKERACPPVVFSFRPRSLQHANIVTTYLYELRPLDEVDGGLGNLDLRLRAPDSADDATTNSSISAAIASGAGGMASGGLGGVRGGRMSCWKLYIVQEFCELVRVWARVWARRCVRYFCAGEWVAPQRWAGQHLDTPGFGCI